MILLIRFFFIFTHAFTSSPQIFWFIAQKKTERKPNCCHKFSCEKNRGSWKERKKKLQKTYQREKSQVKRSTEIIPSSTPFAQLEPFLCKMENFITLYIFLSFIAPLAFYYCWTLQNRGKCCLPGIQIQTNLRLHF